jgi:hypothetical protein
LSFAASMIIFTLLFVLLTFTLASDGWLLGILQFSTIW